MGKKILTFQNLEKRIKKLKSTKKKIVLCHGVFDLLHIGHIDYFKEAKKFGNILIVSVTDDIFVSKGSGRPYFNSIERSRFISSLEVAKEILKKFEQPNASPGTTATPSSKR